MHLIIEKGKDVGKEIAVPSGGMKFGRSPANDFVLADPKVMLFQGRFFFKSDDTLWVTDFSAQEKTTVGGIPVDEHQLAVGELVEVGDTAFRVIHIKPGSGNKTPSKTAESETEEIDLGFKPEKKGRVKKDGEKKSTLMHRVLQVVTVLLVLMVLAVATQVFLSSEPAAAVDAPEVKNLSLVYECVRGSSKNIFRYYLELTDDGTASIQINDLNNRHISKSVNVPAKELETFSRRLGGSGFFEIDRDYIVKAPNRYEMVDIAIYRNGEFNQVKVLNRQLPSEIKSAVSILEEFVSDELDVPFTLLEEPETLLRYAGESFRLGQARFNERDVSPGYLAESVKHFQSAMMYLETLEPKPELFTKAVEKMEQAKAEQDARYKDFMFNAERAIRLGDWREASKYLRILAELIPDRKDERYEIISAKQLEVEENLR